MFTAPLRVDELTAAAAAAEPTKQAIRVLAERIASAKKACREVPNNPAADSSSSSSSNVSCQEPAGEAAVLSAWARRLYAIRVAASRLGRSYTTAQQQHPLLHLKAGQRQQQQAVHAAGEVVQLLQQHLRTVLLPLLFTPTAEVSAIAAGGYTWREVCAVLAGLCVKTDGCPSAVASILLSHHANLGSSSSNHEQQQQLFGLLLSYSKAAVYASELPIMREALPRKLRADAVASANRYSFMHLDAWFGCCTVLSSLVLIVGELEQQQQQQVVCDSSTKVPWLLLHVRVLFVGSKVAAALAAGLAAGEDEASAMLQQCLHAMDKAAKCFLAATAAASGSNEGLQQMGQLRQQLEHQLLPALQDAAAIVEPAVVRYARYGRAASSIKGGKSSGSISLDSISQRVAAVAKQLQQWCLTFCGHSPVTCCCNNPACTNLSGSSEQELVGGKKCVCARCVAARYCSRECQEAMWPHHKQSCKVLKRQRQQQQQQQRDVEQQGEQDQNAGQQQGLPGGDC
jgi:hypothetical protein